MDQGHSGQYIQRWKCGWKVECIESYGSRSCTTTTETTTTTRLCGEFGIVATSTTRSTVVVTRCREILLELMGPIGRPRCFRIFYPLQDISARSANDEKGEGRKRMVADAARRFQPQEGKYCYLIFVVDDSSAIMQSSTTHKNRKRRQEYPVKNTIGGRNHHDGESL